MVTAKIVIAFMLACSVAEYSTEKIALNDIWALDMPGTKNVRDLQDMPIELSNKELLRRSYVRQIEVALTHRNLPNYGEQPRPAIVVKGTGLEALKETARVLTEMAEKGNKKEPELIYPQNTELSLVFYSYMAAQYVRITEVERVDSTTIVKYRFVYHPTMDMSTHFAIIPLGKLTKKGNKPVKIVQEKTIDAQGKPAVPLRGARRYVSDSFTFRIE